MKQTARGTALDALLQMEKNEGYSNLVIDKALKAAELDKRDSALASVIFYGVLEKKLTLDWYICQCLTDPKKKLDKTVRMALRTAVYQIFFLDRIPDSAAVNETVNEIKRRGKTSAAGFVNGVLRTLLRRKEELVLPEGDSPRNLSIRYSVPSALIRLWQDAYGAETAKKLLEAFQEPAKTYVRLNPFYAGETPKFLSNGSELENMAEPWMAAILHGGGDPVGLPEFQAGLFHVQDLSAQIVCEILAPRKGETVYDCCAAPGGKSFTMAQMMKGRGKVTAFDLHPARVKLIEDGARRLRIPNIEAMAADMTKPIEGLPLADKVLCDVPCSGFGVIRRKPEIRYKDLDALKELPELQYAILKNASRLVKPGGVLVYSTCTLDPAENGEVAERFLREDPDFEPLEIQIPKVEALVSSHDYLDAWGNEIPGLEYPDDSIRRVVEEPSHHLTMMPFAGASDGFFAAAFRKL